MNRRKVLVIEDEPAAREALECLLREEGYEVRSAASGRTGIECYLEFHPDVVVCDYYLPDRDGLQVLREVRAADGDSVRFILLTAGLSDEENERALRTEVDAYLGKPINLEQLNGALRERTPAARRKSVKATT